ncbi:MAG TPA: hypothetical protein VG410_04925 [Solirubrobacteraceae bacterium]|jgi:hypothetical protein|nr:hypothetical protein [Solirubrobacteraceae bacterium]
MRRLLVLLVVALALGGATIASASGRQHATRMIVCPVTASVIPCCGPPIAQADSISCCPGPAQPLCQPDLSIGASPDPITAGAKVTVAGALLHTSAAAATTIQLWQELAGDNAFSKDGTATTDGSGNWSITVAAGTVMTNRSWYATGDGLRSATISERVSAIVTLRGAGAATLHGSVTPAHPRARVRLQQLSGSKWVTIARTRLSRHSAFSFARAGIHGTVRVLVAADKENALSVSKQLVLS